jgi:hypothetical protein
MRPVLTDPQHEKNVHTKTASSCNHSRMVDDVRGTKGAKTGKLVCKECQAEFPDPTSQHPDS